jgi:hypothetical protein
MASIWKAILKKLFSSCREYANKKLVNIILLSLENLRDYWKTLFLVPGATSVILIYFLKGLSGTKCNLNENYSSKTRNGKIVPG